MDKTAIESIENWSKLNDRHKVVDICGVLIGVRPFSTKGVKTAIGIVKGGAIDAVVFGGGDQVNVLQLIETSIDGVIDLLLLCTYNVNQTFVVSRDWLEELPADEFMKLAQACFELNKSFFTDKIKPLLVSVFPNITNLFKSSPTENQPQEQSTIGPTM